MPDANSPSASRLLAKLLRKVLPLAIIVIAVVLTVTLINLRPQPPVAPPEERVVPVQVHTVSRADHRVVIRSQGNVLPSTQTTLVAEVSGVIRQVADSLVAGGFVREGDVLLQLDDADYQVAVDQAQANLLSARAQLTLEQAQSEQAAREWDMSGRSRDAAPVLALRTPYLREAEARVLLAESELERARRQLDRTRIRAPYDGLVRERLVDVGQYLNTGAQVARLFATDYAEVRLPLSSDDLRWVDLPDMARDSASSSLPVTLSANVMGKAAQWTASIVRTEGVIDDSSRMMYVVARVQDPYALRQSGARSVLPAGSFVSAAIEGQQLRDVARVPLAAFYTNQDVLVMDQEQRLRRRTVSRVYTDAEWAYVDEGLRDGDQIIVSPVQVPVDGMRVNPGLGQP